MASAAEAAWWFERLVERTSGRRSRLSGEGHRQQSIPEAPIDGVQTGDETISGVNGRVRFATFLMIGFAIVALSLALIGVYGSLWCAVAQRRQEIGVSSRSARRRPT